MKNRVSELLKLENDIQCKAEDVVKNGFHGFTRAQTASLLGMLRMIQFDLKKNKNLDVACWCFASLTERGVASHREFMTKHYYLEYKPGCVKDLDRLMVVLNQPKRRGKGLTDKIKELVVDVLYWNKPDALTGLTSSQVAQTRQACSSALTEMNTHAGVLYEQLAKTLNKRLRYVSASFLTQMLIGCTSQRANNLTDPDAMIEPGEMALIHLASKLPAEKLKILEGCFYKILSDVEKYRHEQFISVKNLSVALWGSRAAIPYWVEFFDKPEQFVPQHINELMEFYSRFTEITALSPNKINSMIKGATDSKRRRSYLTPFKALEKKVEKGQSIYEAVNQLKLDGDIGNIYKAFETWKAGWELREYWAK